MGKITIQTEVYSKVALLMELLMGMADLLCPMVIIIKEKLNMGEQMDMELIKLMTLHTKEILKIM